MRRGSYACCRAASGALLLLLYVMPILAASSYLTNASDGEESSQGGKWARSAGAFAGLLPCSTEKAQLLLLGTKIFVMDVMVDFDF